jgi:imidazolonepropionase-like amidohydrolase
MLGQVKTPLPEAADGASAAHIVRELVAKNVDAIKLFASIPSGAMLSVETMHAAVREAHEAGKPVFVHPNSTEDIERAADAQVDIVAHTTPRGSEWPPKLLSHMHAANMALTPTLALWQHFLQHDRVSVAAQQAVNATNQLRAWHERDGAVLFGTDLGAVDPNPLSEYALMRRAGLGFRDILASLTTVPSQRFRAANAGVVRPGFRADLVVLDGDPAANLRTLGMVHCTLRGGKMIYTAG